MLSVHKLTITRDMKVLEACATTKSQFQHENLLHSKPNTFKQAREK